ncbi:hypothetical protein V2E24_02990 [Mycoplasmopsis ciconiae]|uniref:Uncharacterized protein n=1 Tax=Mycoplasmopsis ciconiae TaxID=561067 RepID=A0ABU7MN83_9BACT|nr:hypothetical protein [Mycoplasmopsis ciconiae]
MSEAHFSFEQDCTALESQEDSHLSFEHSSAFLSHVLAIVHSLLLSHDFDKEQSFLSLSHELCIEHDFSFEHDFSIFNSPFLAQSLQENNLFSVSQDFPSKQLRF